MPICEKKLKKTVLSSFNFWQISTNIRFEIGCIFFKLFKLHTSSWLTARNIINNYNIRPAASPTHTNVPQISCNLTKILNGVNNVLVSAGAQRSRRNDCIKTKYSRTYLLHSRDTWYFGILYFLLSKFFTSAEMCLKLWFNLKWLSRRWKDVRVGDDGAAAALNLSKLTCVSVGVGSWQ